MSLDGHLKFNTNTTIRNRIILYIRRIHLNCATTTKLYNYNLIYQTCLNKFLGLADLMDAIIPNPFVHGDKAASIK